MKIKILTDDDDDEILKMATMLSESLQEKLPAVKVYNIATTLLMMCAAGAPPGMHNDIIEHMENNIESLRVFWEKVSEKETTH